MKKLAIALLPLAVLAGCESMSVAPAGVYELKSGTTINLKEDWTHIPKNWHGAESSVLTKDGMKLNQLHIITVEDGETFIDERSKSVEYPIYAQGSSPIKQIEFVTANLSRMGFESVESKNVVPAKVGGYDGVTMDLVGKFQSGLNLKGRMAMAETDEGLNILVFIAPAMHYYDKDIASVNAIMNSVQFPAPKS